MEDIRGNLWVGELNIGVYRFNKHTESVYFPPTPGIECKDIIKDNNKLWMGLNIYLAQYDPMKNKFTFLSLIALREYGECGGLKR